jgi:hypothetical protein
MTVGGMVFSFTSIMIQASFNENRKTNGTLIFLGA